MFQALLHGLSKGAMGALTKGSISSAIGQGIGSLGNMYATARVSGLANRAYAKASGIDPALTGASYINSPQLQRLSNDPVQSQKELAEHSHSLQKDLQNTNLVNQMALETHRHNLQKSNPNLTESITDNLKSLVGADKQGRRWYESAQMYNQRVHKLPDYKVKRPYRPRYQTQRTYR